MQRDEIRVHKQIVELVHEFHLQAASARCGKIRVVSNHAHSKSDRPPAQFATDPAHPNYAQCLVVKLDTFEMLFVPLLAANICVGLRDLSRR